MSDEEKPIRDNIFEKNAVSMDEMCKKEYPPIKWIIKGYIPESSTNTWAAKSGSFKTTLALYSGQCVAFGVPFLGQETQQGGALYMDAEMYEDGIATRVKGIRKGLHIENIENDNSYYVNYKPGMKLNNMIVLKDLESYIEKHNIKLVIIDTFPRYHTISENKAESVSYVLNDLLRPVITKTKIGLLLLMHLKKTPTKENFNDWLDEIRGSSEQANLSDSVCVLLREKGRKTPIISFLNEKSRYGLELEEKRLRFDISEDFEMCQIVDITKVPTAITTQTQSLYDKIKEFIKTCRLNGNKIIETNFIKEWLKAEVINYNDNTLNNALKSIEDDGLIKHTDKRGVWDIKPLTWDVNDSNNGK